MNWLSSGPFTVFDLETTGFSAVRDRIIEIGAVRVELDGSVSRFQTLVNPGVPIPPRLTALTGIDDAMVADSPKFREAGFKFMDFARKSRLVAHNARFDEGCLKAAFGVYQMDYPDYVFHDTLSASRRYFGKRLPNHQLQTVAAACGYDLTNHHHALADAEACAFIAMKLL